MLQILSIKMTSDIVSIIAWLLLCLLVIETIWRQSLSITQKYYPRKFNYIPLPHGKYTGAPFDRHMIPGYRKTVIRFFKNWVQVIFPSTG